MMYKKNFVAVVKCGGKILRERDGDIVYLPFNSEYSLLLKNKDARRALVSVEVDGTDALNGHRLVLDGNSSRDIKGFMRDFNETNRFKFINKTKEIQNYRGDRVDDGLIRITYQFEKLKREPVTITYTPQTFPTKNTPPWSYPTTDFDFNPYRDYVYGFSDLKSNSSYRADDTEISYNSYYTVSMAAPALDEGITVKGQKINQQYVGTTVGSLDPKIYTIVLQLKGMTGNSKVVRKPITVKTRLTCETCGRRNKSTNKFCVNCGTYLN